MCKKHKWVSGLRKVSAFNQLRQTFSSRPNGSNLRFDGFV